VIKKIKTFWLGFIGSLVLLSACYKDQGNYTYNDVNTISVKLDSSAYNVLIGQSLKIKPVLQLSMDSIAGSYDTSRYEYKWMIRDTTNAGGKDLVIATTRDLDISITGKEAFSGPMSGYKLYYYVKDKRTGLQWLATAKLSVITSVYEGWLALCEVNGSSRLDMAICTKGSYDNKLFPDVLGMVGSGLDMSGKPVGVTYCTRPSALTGTVANAIYITTSNGTNRIEPNYFSWAPNMNLRYDFISNIAENFAADVIVGTGGPVNYLHTPDGNLYSYASTFPQIRWGPQVNLVSGEPEAFKCSPFIATDPTLLASTAGAILFDVTKKRFMSYWPSTTSNPLYCRPLPTLAGAALDYKNVGMDLAYMEEVNYNSGEVFAVLKNPTTGKYYLARIAFGRVSNPTYALNYYAQITGTDIDKAEFFAVNPDYGYLFYSVGSKVYEYDMGLKKSFLMQDYGNKKITILKFNRFHTNNYTTPAAGYQKLNNKLIVATYDPAQPNTSGTVDLWTVPVLNAALQSFRSIPGFGKIQSLTYRER
jgi:hypothetical protein